MNQAHSARRSFRLAAEFAVIVIGVLVALAVDQWVSARSDRVSEFEYVQALSRDVRADSTLFVTILLPVAVRADSAMTAIAPVVRGYAPFPADTLGFLRAVIASSGGFVQLGDRTTFDELLATGSLQVIEAAALRSSLVAYYAEKESVENFTAWRASGYADVVRAYLPGDPFLEAPAEAEIRAYGLRRALDAVHSDDFARRMNRHANYLRFMRPRLERVTAQSEALLSQLRVELEALR